MKESLKVLKKIAKAKGIIRKSPVKKAGRNTYSNYDYYTPEQIVNIVQDACSEVGILTMFGTSQDEHGLSASMSVIDLDSGESVTYNQVTAIPAIKATNVAQQLGGMNTYSNRYLLMFIFDITEDGLDPDTTENTKKANAKPKKATPKAEAPSKPIMDETHTNWDSLVNFIAAGGSVAKIREKYAMSKKTETELNKQADAKK